MALRASPPIGAERAALRPRSASPGYKLKGPMRTKMHLLVLALAILLSGTPGYASPPTSQSGSKENGKCASTAPGQSEKEQKSKDKRDAEITKTVLTKLVSEEPDIAVHAKHLKISTVSGHVTLTGKVRNETQKSKVGSIAESVAGANQVDNQLAIK
jgi:BON domain